MTSRQDKIRAVLTARFADSEISFTNDSARHAGHGGDDGSGESHLALAISSPAFHGMSRITAHRAVMDILKPFFDDGLHALQIKII